MQVCWSTLVYVQWNCAGPAGGPVTGRANVPSFLTTTVEFQPTIVGMPPEAETKVYDTPSL